MADVLNTPFLWVIVTMALYGVAYWGYGKWIDRNVWRSNAKTTTPAHMYMDGVEYFPVSRYVLWGYQFKSVAALGPILGPFVGVQFGWLPALLWIIAGNFFIGWLQDYGSMMLSVRKEGRSFGPITYEFTGARGRTNLLAFVMFYLIIISATFIALIATFWNLFHGTFVATLGIFVAGILTGRLLYRRKMNVFAVTGIGLFIVVLSIYVGALVSTNFGPGVFPADICVGDQLPMPQNPRGACQFDVAVWAALCAVILFAAAILPTPSFIQPTNYLAFYPAYAAIIFILIGALVTPLTDISVQLPAFTGLYNDAIGPLWPILFVAIACGAISGWHSLVSSSSSSKQLDIETDALPVGGGAMLSEGLLALASLAAYMVLARGEVLGQPNFFSWVDGAVKLTSPFLGGLTVPILETFFGLMLVIYAITVQALVTRFFRLVAAETWSEGRFRALGNKNVATAFALVVPWAFAVSGGWWALWLYFGGANQLLAGLAIMLITIHLTRVRAPSRYSLVPAIFMIVTTLSALVWQAYWFLNSAVQYLGNVPFPGRTPPTALPWISRNVRAPIDTAPYALVALGVNAVFVVVGAVLFLVGLSMAIRLFRSYSQSLAQARAKAPAAADGGMREK